MIKKIVILTSGGDAPGMNAAIRAVVRSAIHHGIEVFGSENGFNGLVNNKLIPLNARSVANCIQRGGTILKTKRVPEFHQPLIREKCREFLKAKNIEGLIVLGGDGSFTGAQLLSEHGGPLVIGIPCTIDNDIAGTDYSIGFDTACNTALQAIDRIRDTALSLERNFIIEVMGRSSGFIAVEVGIAAGAEFILIPEFPIEYKTLGDKIKKHCGIKMASIIVAAESDHPGHTFQLAEKLKEKTTLDYRVCVLGHIQRGGTPTAFDRVSASLMGAKAIETLLSGKKNRMIAKQNGKILPIPFAKPGKTTRYFDKLGALKINQIICEN
jgi:6-phosphofructokinase 1